MKIKQELEIPNERWKLIPTLDNGYPTEGFAISDHGRLGSMYVPSYSTPSDTIQRICKTHPKTKHGYLDYKLPAKPGFPNPHLSIHRAVATAFCNKPSTEHDEVNHLDGNTANNHFTNLAWSTRLQNNNHKHTLGQGSFTSANVALIRRLAKQGTPMGVIAQRFPNQNIHTVEEAAYGITYTFVEEPPASYPLNLSAHQERLLANFKQALDIGNENLQQKILKDLISSGLLQLDLVNLTKLNRPKIASMLRGKAAKEPKVFDSTDLIAKAREVLEYHVDNGCTLTYRQLGEKFGYTKDKVQTFFTHERYSKAREGLDIIDPSTLASRKGSSKIDGNIAREVIKQRLEGTRPSVIASNMNLSRQEVSSITVGRIWGKETEDLRTQLS
jgi:hypothetical protein